MRNLSKCLLGFGLLLVPGRMAGSDGPRLPSGPPRPSAGVPRCADLLSRMPLTFEANRGQAEEGTAFLARGSGWSVAIRGDGATFHLGGGPGSAVAMRLRGARPDAPVKGLDPLPSRTNYFLGNDPSRWVTDVPHFGSLLASEAVPGVALRWRGLPEGNLRYDLELAAGVDPESVVLDFEGAKSLRANEYGVLLVESNAGSFQHSVPIAWQDAPEGRRSVACSYAVASRTVRFHLGVRDPALPVVIDPTVQVSTIFGPGNLTMAYGVAIDNGGNVFLTGYTNVSGLGTSGAYQSSRAGTEDAFVARFAPGSSSFTYLTYLGGSSSDWAQALAVDDSGNAYLTGHTASSNFPTRNPAQGSLVVAQDAFVAKIGSTGETLVYSTYFGGSGSDDGYGIAVDASGYAWIAGSTNSDDLPKVNPLDSTRQGYEGFLARFSPTGSGIAFSTYFGGGQTDDLRGVAVARDGTVWAAGQSGSTDFPTKKAIQGSLGGGGVDACLVGVAGDGSSLLYASYLGGSSEDVACGIAADLDGYLWVVGETKSSDFPTKSPLQGTFGGYRNAFYYKFDVANLATVHASYLGGSGSDSARGVAVDPEGDAYLTGQTTSSDFPLASALDGSLGGSWDTFVAKAKSDGSSLLFSTYHGASSDDDGHAVAADGSMVAIVGGTRSTDFPQVNGRGDTWSGQWDGTLAIVQFLPAPPRSLRLDGPTGAQVPLAWTDPNSGVYGTQVQRRVGTGSYTTLDTVLAGVNAFVDSSSAEDTDYDYRVRGTSGGGSTGWSNLLRVHTALRPVGNLQAQVNGHHEVSMSWVDLSAAETGYEVRRRIGLTGSFTVAATLSAGSTMWTDDAVQADTTYQYVVRTLAQNGNTSDSGTLTVATAPGDPDQLSAQALGDVAVQLSWEDNSSTETGFEVQRRDDGSGGGFVAVGAATANATTFTDPGLAPEHAYSWRVRAVNGSGGSDWSAEVSRTTPPAAPTGLAVTALASNAVLLAWTDNSSAETEFAIDRKEAGDPDFTEVATPAADSLTAVDDTALQESSLTYRVRARNPNGTSRPAMADPVATPAQLVIERAGLRAAARTRPARLTASGSFDVGPGVEDLTGTADLGIGDATVAVPGFTVLNGGSLLRFEGEGLRLDLKPSTKGTSAVAFALSVEGGAAANLDPEGLLSLSFRSGTFRCAGTARLAGGKVAGGKGAWPWESANVILRGLKADVVPAGDQSFTLQALFQPYTEVHGAAPDLEIAIGNKFVASLPGSLFTAKKGKFTYKTREEEGWSITLDPLKGTLSMKASHVDLGQIDVGPVPVKVDLSIGGVRYVDTPVLISNGKTVTL